MVEEPRPVSVAAIAQHGHDGVAGTQTPRHLDRCTYIDPGRTAEVEAFVAKQLVDHGNGLRITDPDRVIDRRALEVGGPPAVADPSRGDDRDF